MSPGFDAAFSAGLAGGGGGEVVAMDTDRIPTYVSGLDDRIGGGIPRGHVVLVAGPAGSLKSTLVYRVLWHEARDRGAPGLYLSMEQSRKSLVAHMAAFGMDPARAKSLNVIDVRALRRELDTSSNKPHWLLGLRHQLSRYKAELGCDLLAVDSLDALYALTPFENPRNEIFQFLEELRDLDATTFLVSEMPGDRKTFGAHNVEEFLADGILHLRIKEVEVGLTTSVRRFVAVLKMRGVEHDMDYYPLLVQKGRFEIVTD